MTHPRREPVHNVIARALLAGLMPDQTALASFLLGEEIPHNCRFYSDKQKLAMRHSIHLHYLKRLAVKGKVAITDSASLKNCVRNILAPRPATPVVNASPVKMFPVTLTAKPMSPAPAMPLTKSVARAELQRLQVVDSMAAAKFYDQHRALLLSFTESGRDEVFTRTTRQPIG